MLAGWLTYVNVDHGRSGIRKAIFGPYPQYRINEGLLPWLVVGLLYGWMFWHDEHRRHGALRMDPRVSDEAIAAHEEPPRADLNPGWHPVQNHPHVEHYWDGSKWLDAYREARD